MGPEHGLRAWHTGGEELCSVGLVKYERSWPLPAVVPGGRFSFGGGGRRARNEKVGPSGAVPPALSLEVRGGGGGFSKAVGGRVAGNEFGNATGRDLRTTVAKERQGVCPSGPIGGRRDAFSVKQP